MEGKPTDEDAPRKGARRIDLPSSDVIERASVQSVAIAARILKALAGAGGVLALKDLAAATGMPRSKVHRYLVSLRSTGLISQEADGGRYRIGPAAVTIGLVGLGRMGPVRQLNEAVPRLRDRINETVTAAIWSDNGPTIIAMEESDHLVTMNLRIGSVLPLINTAIGRLFLAYLPSAMTQRLVAAERRAAASLRAALPRATSLTTSSPTSAGAACRACAGRFCPASMRLPRRCSTIADNWWRWSAWWRVRKVRGDQGRTGGECPERGGRRIVAAARPR